METYAGHAGQSCLVLGARVPVALTSRVDPVRARLRGC